MLPNLHFFICASQLTTSWPSILNSRQKLEGLHNYSNWSKEQKWIQQHGRSGKKIGNLDDWVRLASFSENIFTGPSGTSRIRYSGMWCLLNIPLQNFDQLWKLARRKDNIRPYIHLGPAVNNSWIRYKGKIPSVRDPDSGHFRSYQTFVYNSVLQSCH